MPLTALDEEALALLAERGSSRRSASAAGWVPAPPSPEDEAYYKQLMKERVFPRPFSWLRPRVLLETRNYALGALVKAAKTDIVNDERQRWIAAQRACGVLERTIEHEQLERFSFVAVGDPGEADESQYVTVKPLRDKGRDTDFMIVVSDVIYPTGESNDYVDAFYRPYRCYRKPIYAIPGNHDWYALLTGFMWNLCGAEPLPSPTYRLASYSWQERLARFLWLRPKAPQRTLLRMFRAERWNCGREGVPEPSPHQRTPYFAIETANLRIVCIDTGTSGTLDREQGFWLHEVSRGGKRKILVTGKPIYVDNGYRPCRIEWEPRYSDDERPEKTGDPSPRRTGDDPLWRPPFDTVDEIVRHREHNYIAVIGGDTHNYQRYPVRLKPECEGDEPKTVQYFVAGGGGAFLTPTHAIPLVGPTAPDGSTRKPKPKYVEDVLDRERSITPNDFREAVTEDDFRCYPLRGDSLTRMMRGTVPRLWKLVGGTFLLGLLLLWTALQVWNPSDGDIRGREFLGVDLGWLRYLTLEPWSDVWYLNFEPFGWLPGYDYDLWVTRGLAILVLAGASGLLLLPWFRLGTRITVAIVAGVVAAYLWPWGELEEPELLAGIVIAGLAPIILPRERVRALGPLVKGAIVFLLAVAAAWIWDGQLFENDWLNAFSVALAGFAAVAILLIGGPPLGILMGVVTLVLVGLLGLLVLAIKEGLSAVAIAVVAGLLLLFSLRYFYALRWLLLFGGKVTADRAAKHVADLLDVAPVRAVLPAVLPAGLIGALLRRFPAWLKARSARKKSEALLPSEGKGRLLFFNETIYSAVFDMNDAPFFKSFLRVHVDSDEVRIFCFGVADEAQVTLEDYVEWTPEEGWVSQTAFLHAPGDGTLRGKARFYRVTNDRDPRLVVDLADDDGRSSYEAVLTGREQMGTAEWNGSFDFDHGRADLGVADLPDLAKWGALREITLTPTWPQPGEPPEKITGVFY
jgi:hypothetical protein